MLPAADTKREGRSSLSPSSMPRIASPPSSSWRQNELDCERTGSMEWDADEKDSMLSPRMRSWGDRIAASSWREQTFAGGTCLHWTNRRLLAIVFVLSASLVFICVAFFPSSPSRSRLIHPFDDIHSVFVKLHPYTATPSSPALPEIIARHPSLSDQECEMAFPLLWPQLRARKEFQLAKGGVRESDINSQGAGARVALIDGNLYVKSIERPFGTRTDADLAALHDAIITSPEPLPDVDLYFQALDKGLPVEVLVTAAPDPGDPAWLIPDFGFYSWPEPILTDYKGVRRQIERVESEVSWADKQDKLFWRGAFLSPIRQELRNLTQLHPEWADVEDVMWSAGGKGSVPLWDHCRHKYLVHAEGFDGAYSGRLKHLLNCRSVTISHNLHWTQHFHPALDSSPDSPNQNIIILPAEGWSTLPSVMEELKNSNARAERIADNAKRIMGGRYLTPAATNCYWRRLLREYSETLAFKPEVGNGKDYESFLLMGKVEWAPH